MEITVKRDVKIDSDDVLKRLSNYISEADEKDVHISSATLKDAYDLIKYLINSKKKPIKKEYYVGDLIYFIKNIGIGILTCYEKGKVYQIINTPADLENGYYILRNLQTTDTVRVTKNMLDHCTVNLKCI